jgi:hypothetical protein
MIQYFGDKCFQFWVDGSKLTELFKIVNPNLDYEIRVYSLPEDLDEWERITGKNYDDEEYTLSDYEKLAQAFEDEEFTEPEFIFVRDGKIVEDQLTGDVWKTRLLIESIAGYYEIRL